MSDEQRFVLTTNSYRETELFGTKLGRKLMLGDVVCLRGDLGAGKTCLTRGIAEGMGIDPDKVSSPTFILAQEYDGEKDMCHMDLYRLESYEAVVSCGLDEYMTEDVVTVIEWPDNMEILKKLDRLEIDIVTESEDVRSIYLVPFGSRYIGIIKELILS